MLHVLIIWLLSAIPRQNIVKTTPLTNGNISQESTNLHYLIREQKDIGPNAPLLVLLHGYGSNESDLFSFASKIPDNWIVVSVRAPISISPNKFKWYKVKMIDDKITLNFNDVEESRKLILKLISEIGNKYNVDKSKIVTAGFSQGANMALALALTEPDQVLSAACFSGRYMEEINPLIKNTSSLKSKNFFISHGTKDKMLPMYYAEENKKLLEDFGITITISTDKTGHSISAKQLNDFVEWTKLI